MMDVIKLDDYIDAMLALNLAWLAGMAAAACFAWAMHEGKKYMAKQVPMGGAKLSQRVVDRLRGLGDKCDVTAEARRYQIHPKSIRRILNYETWKPPGEIDMPDDEHKQCLWCGNVFGRRYKSHRWRTDEQWESKRTCGPSCNMYLMWKMGVYNDRKQ